MALHYQTKLVELGRLWQQAAAEHTRKLDVIIPPVLCDSYFGRWLSLCMVLAFGAPLHGGCRATRNREKRKSRESRDYHVDTDVRSNE